MQSLEGAIDTAHFSFLHAVLTKDEKEALEIYSRSAALGDQSKPDDRMRWIRDDPRPKFSILGHDAGLVIGGARKTDGTDLYWRIAQFLMPNHALVPVAMPGEVYHGQAWVPVDRHQLLDLHLQLAARPRLHQLRARAVRRRLRRARHVDDDYMPLRNIRNDYLIDRAAQKHQSFTGITGVSEQDAAIQDSQGPIQDRTREHLGPTDLGIVEFRKLVMGAARALQQGSEPKSTQAAKKYAVRSGGWIAGPDKDLATVMTERFGHRHGYVGNEYGLGE